MVSAENPRDHQREKQVDRQARPSLPITGAVPQISSAEQNSNDEERHDARDQSHLNHLSRQTI
jgi:hypothetical protein